MGQKMNSGFAQRFIVIYVCLISPLVWSQSSDEVRLKRISELRNEMKHPWVLVRSGNFEQVQTELAKLGEKEQLQQLQCEIDFGSPTVRTRSIVKLRAVSGWFSILALGHLLEDNVHNLQPEQTLHNTYPPLRFQALQILPHVVPNPPVGEVNFMRAYSNEAAVWLEWLQKNRESLSKLEPTGIGLVHSEKVCREVLKNDPEKDSYPGHPGVDD